MRRTMALSPAVEEMPYRISYIDTSMSTDEQQTTGRLRTEEFPTEPATLARARELLEDVSYRTVSYRTVLISEIPASTWGAADAPLSSTPGVFAADLPDVAHAAWRGDRGEDFAVV